MPSTTDGACIRTRTTAALALAGALTLTACGDDDPDPPPDPSIEKPDDLDDGAEDGPEDDGAEDGPEDDGAEDGPEGDGAAGPVEPQEPDVSAPTDDEPTAPAEEAAGAPPLDDEATTDDRDQANAGSDPTVTDVRVGTHDGFDRITVELDGDAQVGWFTAWDDEAILDGSGRPADVAGEMVLTLAVRGVLLPPDRPEDVEAWDGETVAAADGSEVLVEVVDGVLFEGQQQIFLGAEREVPYRIQRFESPQRIVIDLVHG